MARVLNVTNYFSRSAKFQLAERYFGRT